MKKKFQNLSFAVIAVAVLCAGTVSARQLRSGFQGSTCGGTCSLTGPCPTSNCVCSLTPPTPPFFTKKPARGAPSPKKERQEALFLKGELNKSKTIKNT